MSEETQGDVERKEAEPGNREVSVWIVRHLEPHPSYREDSPLVSEKATLQAEILAESLVNEIKNGESLVFYGAGTKARHQESLNLVKNAILEEAKKSRKEVQLIDFQVPKRPSLRPVQFWKYHKAMPQIKGKEGLYWLRTGDTLGGEIESVAHVEKRILTLTKGIVGYTKRQPGGPRVHWLLVTSAEVVAPLMKRLWGIEKVKILGMEPGGWIRIDVPRGEFTGHVGLTHHKGVKKEISLTSEK